MLALRARTRPTGRHAAWARLALPGAALLILVTTGCGSSAGGPAARPHTPATLEIARPEPNAVTPPDLTVRLVLRHAHLVPGTRTGGAIRPNEGHIHVSVDGQVVAMINRLALPLQQLTPGDHTIEAEFVAADHLPFANRVVAAVSFRVA